VTVSFRMETTNNTGDAALAENSKIMNRVVDALKAAGIKDNETSTSSFGISPNYNYSRSSYASGRTITGYTASNAIEIQSTNINNTSKWIDSALAAGANTVGRIDFALSDKKLEETKINIIRQAMQDARTKADAIASAAGIKVIGIKSIALDKFAMQQAEQQQDMLNEQNLESQRMAEQQRQEQARLTPIISAQEEEVSTNVAAVFLLR
jgi:uncharacterized protein